MPKWIYRVYCTVPGSMSREIRIPAESIADAERIAKEVYGAISAMVSGADGPFTGLHSFDETEERREC